MKAKTNKQNSAENKRMLLRDTGKALKVKTGMKAGFLKITFG